jgi:hypothetical protein
MSTIRVYWGEQPGDTPGWYAEIWRGGCLAAASEKIDYYLVAAQEYGRDQADDLETDLLVAYPGARVVIER